LTQIRLRLYSGAMIADFNLLSEKIDRLAALTALLRRENAELRLQTVALSADNAALANRMQDAQQRVAALISRLPADTAADHDIEAST
jgi:cell division protein ZapB